MKLFFQLFDYFTLIIIRLITTYRYLFLAVVIFLTFCLEYLVCWSLSLLTGVSPISLKYWLSDARGSDTST